MLEIVPSSSEHFCPTCGRSFDEHAAICPDDGTQLIAIGTGRDPLEGLDIDGRFTIKTLIGEGGMGRVYEGFQHSVGREVAIKIMDMGGADSKVAAKRFLREAKLASTLVHPNTISVIDFGRHDKGFYYLVMERLQGLPLSELLAQSKRLEWRRVVRISLQLAEGLDAAHTLNIVHRDLKPSNIMVLNTGSKHDTVKVLDFGLAKLLTSDGPAVTEAGVVLGTLAYVAPEVVLGREPSPSADLYALGVILYEMLAGETPFSGPDKLGLMRQHVSAPPLWIADSLAPIALRRAAMKLLHKEPAERFASAAELRELLIQIRDQSSTESVALSSEPAGEKTTRIQVDPDTLPDSSLAVLSLSQEHAPQRFPPKRRGLMILGLLFFTVAVGGAITALMRADDDVAKGLAPSKVMVEHRINSVPRATLWSEGVVLGKTPQVLTFEASSDVQRFELRKTGYVSHPFSLMHKDSQALDITLEKQEDSAVRKSNTQKVKTQSKGRPLKTPNRRALQTDKTMTSLRLFATPNAAVFVAGKNIGTTPLVYEAARRLGSIKVVFRKKGYSDIEKTIDLSKDQRLNVNFTPF